jgi:hypothetical protein
MLLNLGRFVLQLVGCKVEGGTDSPVQRGMAPYTLLGFQTRCGCGQFEVI